MTAKTDLTEETKHLLIAQALGWQIEKPEGYESDPRYWRWCPPGKQFSRSLNYTARPGKFFESLDAMHEAEQSKLQELIKGRYWLKLMEQEVPVKIEGEDRTELVGHWNTTAAQRAEAFGLTLGLWH